MKAFYQNVSCVKIRNNQNLKILWKYSYLVLDWQKENN